MLSILPSQRGVARALIDMDQADLARRAVVPRHIIADFENGSVTPRATGRDPHRPRGRRHQAARLSIVVLPFANLSGDPGQDYLVDALTDELTTSLARIPGNFEAGFLFGGHRNRRILSLVVKFAPVAMVIAACRAAAADLSRKD